MPISRDQLANIISNRAAALCNPNADKKFDAMAGRENIQEQRGADGKIIYHDIPKPDYNYDDGFGDEMLGGSYGYSKPAGQPQTKMSNMNYTSQTAKNSSVPSAIKQSMLENRIDVREPVSETSFLDKLASQQQQRKQVVEQRQPVQQAGIDYALIKSIVKECLAESQVLNENTLKQIHLNGGKIRLVDNSGNIYSAKLEKTGNINDKKK